MNAPEWNGGSHCGQTVTITNNQNGNTQQAQVADLCPGCGYGSLDMSTGLFSALNNGNMDAGVFPISWSFGSGAAASNNNQQQQQQQQQQAPLNCLSVYGRLSVHMVCPSMYRAVSIPIWLKTYVDACVIG